MAKRKATDKHEWRLAGGNDTDKVRITKMLPTDDGGIAISWATNALMHRGSVDSTGKFAREGEALPEGDYMLSLVGPLATEDVFEIRKHSAKNNPVLSWRDA